MRLVLTGSAGRGHITNDGISVCASCRFATRKEPRWWATTPSCRIRTAAPVPHSPLVITFRIATPGKADQPRSGLGKWLGSKLPRLFSQPPLGPGRCCCPRVPRARYRSPATHARSTPPGQIRVARAIPQFPVFLTQTQLPRRLLRAELMWRLRKLLNITLALLFFLSPFNARSTSMSLSIGKRTEILVMRCEASL